MTAFIVCGLPWWRDRQKDREINSAFTDDAVVFA
jgi:hypothetical protein